jgi:hypothetical protein
MIAEARYFSLTLKLSAAMRMPARDQLQNYLERPQ